MNTNSNDFPSGDERMEERLWDYIDGVSSVKEKTMIDDLVLNNSAWKEKYAELLDITQLLNHTELDHPSVRFTRNVMEEIGRMQIAPAAKNYINNKVIWSIGIFFIVLIIGFLIYGFGQTEWTDGSSSSFTDKLNKVDYSKFFNNTWINIFMMINVILGLLLFDNYLTTKKAEMRKRAGSTNG
jgi:TM2 domain-containing membrane protein YozV